MLVKASSLEPWCGEPLPTEVNTATLRYENGRVETIEVAPYTVAVKYPLAIEQLWRDDELAKIGLTRVIAASCPDGKRFVGEPRLERDGKVVREVRDVEPLPPPPATVTISREEHERLVADAEKWRTNAPPSREAVKTLDPLRDESDPSRPPDVL